MWELKGELNDTRFAAVDLTDQTRERERDTEKGQYKNNSDQLSNLIKS